RDDGAVGLDQRLGGEAELLDRVIPQREVVTDALVTAVRVGLGGDLGRDGADELGVDVGQEPLDTVLGEGVEALADARDVLGAHRWPVNSRRMPEATRPESPRGATSGAGAGGRSPSGTGAP